jgi:hypothetical protein
MTGVAPPHPPRGLTAAAESGLTAAAGHRSGLFWRSRSATSATRAHLTIRLVSTTRRRRGSTRTTSSTTSAALDHAALLRHPTTHCTELFRCQHRTELVLLLPLRGLTTVADVAQGVAMTILNGTELGPLLGGEFRRLLPLHAWLLGGRRRVLGNHRRNEAGGQEGKHWADRHTGLHVRRLSRVGTERTPVLPRR